MCQDNIPGEAVCALASAKTEAASTYQTSEFSDKSFAYTERKTILLALSLLIGDQVMIQGGLGLREGDDARLFAVATLDGKDVGTTAVGQL